MALHPCDPARVIPGIYGPSDHYLRYKETILFIGWNGGIELHQGNWLDAAIALRISIKSHMSGRHLVFGHIHVDNQLELSLHIAIDTQGNDLFMVAPQLPDSPSIVSSKQNFPILKENYDKIKNLSVFW